MESLRKLDLKERKQLSIIFGGIAALSILFTIICLSVDGWVKTTADGESTKYSGIFVEDGSYMFLCTGDMTVAECGYLQASKISGIVSLLFGSLALFVVGRYVIFTEGYLTSLGATLVSILGYFQTLFGLICVVYYSYLKNSFFEYDDLNVEYADNKKSTYDWAFQLMCTVVAITFIYSTATLVLFVHLNNDSDVKRRKAQYIPVEQGNYANRQY